MITEDRQKAILTYLTKQGNTSVAELCRLFGVSEMTIRRDLKILSKKDLLRRTYGGAIPSEQAFFEMSLKAKSVVLIEEKRAIGRACGEMVRDGETIFLDSGTTTLEIARHIRHKTIFVVTNDLNIASVLSHSPSINLYITGGELRRGTNNLIGNKAINFFDGIQGSKLFLGVEGIDAKAGLTIPDLGEVQIKQRMMRSVDRVIAVADHSKLGRCTMGIIAPVTAAQILVTDSLAANELLEPIEKLITVLKATVTDES